MRRRILSGLLLSVLLYGGFRWGVERVQVLERPSAAGGRMRDAPARLAFGSELLRPIPRSRAERDLSLALARALAAGEPWLEADLVPGTTIAADAGFLRFVEEARTAEAAQPGCVERTLSAWHGSRARVALIACLAKVAGGDPRAVRAVEPIARSCFRTGNAVVFGACARALSELGGETSREALASLGHSLATGPASLDALRAQVSSLTRTEPIRSERSAAGRAAPADDPIDGLRGDARALLDGDDAESLPALLDLAAGRRGTIGQIVLAEDLQPCDVEVEILAATLARAGDVWTRALTLELRHRDESPPTEEERRTFDGIRGCLAERRTTAFAVTSVEGKLRLRRFLGRVAREVDRAWMDRERREHAGIAAAADLVQSLDAAIERIEARRLVEELGS